MAKSETAKLRSRAESAETAAIGMGFLLVKLRGRYGGHFGVGISQQVDQAIQDYRRIEAGVRARERAASERNTQEAAQ